MKQATAPTFAAPVGTVRRLLEDVSVTIGELVEITGHPSGTRFDGPAVVTSAWTNTVFGVGRPHIGAWVKAVSLSDPAGRVVSLQLASSLTPLS